MKKEIKKPTFHPDVVEEMRIFEELLKKEGLKVRLLGFQIMEDAICLPENPVGYASALYAVLHDLDAMGLDRIVIALPPDTPQWLAIRDRLNRAATPAD